MSLFKRRKRKLTMEDIIIDSVVMIVMIAVIIVTIYPFYYIIIHAFNDSVDSSLGGMYLYPRQPTLENFKTLLANDEWFNAIFISVARTVVGTLLGVIFTSVVAYAISFEDLLFRGVYYKIFIFTMYFGGGMIPFYILLKSLKMLNTFWVYVIPGMLDVYYMLILVNFYQSLPKSLYESAWLDGAGDLTVYFRIVLPLSKASLATIALYYAVGQWNAWMDSVYYVTSSELRPMSYLMMDIIQRSATMSTMEKAQMGYASRALKTSTTSLQMASMVLAVVPILAIYPFLQKYFVKGVMIGSIKG